jgi:hypothetical protein
MTQQSGRVTALRIFYAECIACINFGKRVKQPNTSVCRALLKFPTLHQNGQ